MRAFQTTPPGIVLFAAGPDTEIGDSRNDVCDVRLAHAKAEMTCYAFSSSEGIRLALAGSQNECARNRAATHHRGAALCRDASRFHEIHAVTQDKILKRP